MAGKVRGRGKTRWYGSFKYKGKAWKAHRWSAKFIHGFDIENLDVDHKCGNTLCVRHLQAIPGDVNAAYYWIRVEVGLFDLEEEPAGEVSGVPFYDPPEWWTQHNGGPPLDGDDPPF